MTDWKRGLIRTLVFGIEAGLSLVVLFSIAILHDIATHSYGREQASGFAFAFFGLWILASFALVVVGGCHAVVEVFRLREKDAPETVRDQLPRLALEGLVAVAIFLAVLPGGFSDSVIPNVLAASGVLGLTVTLHVVVEVVRFVGHVIPVN